jgi:hypothetical protein
MPLLAVGGLFGPTALAAESSIKVADSETNIQRKEEL